MRGYWSTVGYRLRHDPVTLCFGAIVLLIVLTAIFAPLLAPFDPYKESVVLRLKPFGYRGHPLGTDELGRDLLSRLIYGGRSSLLMGLVPVCIATVLGGTLGVIGGFAGRQGERRDHAHDGRVLRVPLGAAGGGDLRRDGRRHGERHGGAGAGVHPRDVPRRGDRDRAGAQPRLHRGGARDRRRHVHHRALPRTRQRAGPVFIYASSLVSVSILLASGLSFLGLGVKPPTPDWGLMLSTLRQSIYIVPISCALPGAAIFVTSICFNLVSDGIRSAMDVRL